ncbi:MAG: ABC transporter substrate-binding protein [Lachnospiraceae bacterium]|nr:ABC transporter substrate-binding protein [Lachnospiraceae bacterium]
MKKRFLAFVMSAALMVSVLGGCSNSSGDSNTGSGSASGGDTIRIGTSFPLTGTLADDGNLLLDAVQLAVDQCNEAGGINGKQVEIASEDDESSPTSAAAIANKFVADDSIYGVITSYNSSCALAQVPVFDKSGLTAISPVATSPDLTGSSDYFFRTCVSDAYVGTLCANMCSDLGYKNIGVLYENDDYGYGLYSQFEEQAKANSMEIGYAGNFVLGETKDFNSLLTSVKNAGCDAIFIAGFNTETVLIANQKEALGMGDIPIVGGDGIYSPELISEGGDLVEGIYTLGAFTENNEDEVVQNFISAYQEAYGSVPGNWAALAYDATNVLLEAMKSCGDDLSREKINEAVTNIDYVGVTGENKFVDGDVEKEYLTLQVQNGEFVVVE